jgi:murein DD-endopeptidase MepM/ murein hydrolase activator NlpD
VDQGTRRRRLARAAARVTSASTLFAVLLGGVLGGEPAAADSPVPQVTYRPPVDAPLVDTFRPPATPYGKGNRGVDYATTPGQPVLAASDGEVVFAGNVGTTTHVVVLHDDGVRTSYSFLAETAVRRGQHVRKGQAIGAAGPANPLHFGARAPSPTDQDAYLDPLVLLGQGPSDGRARLVDDPDADRPLPTEAEERRRLARALGDLATYAGARLRWLKDRGVSVVERKVDLARVLVDDAIDLGVPIPATLALAALRWQDDQARCTAPTTAIPPQPNQRRIVVLVGGLGSATGDAAVLTTDTTALGYAGDDVHQFSYTGPGQPYAPADTQGDIDRPARRLAAQLTALQRQHPGVPVDVIAHSQGGLVARSAVAVHHATPATLVTLGTPHRGADLATAGAALDATTSGHLALEAITRTITGPTAGLDLNSRSIQQMSETSDALADLADHPWPAPTTTHVVSIAARGDAIVPNHQSRLDPPAYNAVVTPGGHASLPATREATEEIRRALARQPPTCRSLADAVIDEAIGRQTSQLHDQVGATLAAGGLFVDFRTRRLATR